MGSWLAVALCAAMLAAAPADAAPSQSATVKANVVKPLVLTWVQDLSLGTIALKPGSWSNATVSISRTGVFTCANPNVTCSGAVTVARYRVVGSNNQAVRISAPNVTLVNQSDSSKQLTLTVDRPATITMPNSGQQGVVLSLGGSINLSSTTADGVYAGTFNVTVDY
ncbi:MAG TPA: DUF4402 domain-containing protein [Sphingomicrobium sp.]|nr:DUF4402 domain-containing protein [Sphingomicrobium sp.]